MKIFNDLINRMSITLITVYLHCKFHEVLCMVSSACASYENIAA